MASERTFIMIKPDGVTRNLTADIIKRFEQRGYKLVAMKFMQVCSLARPGWPTIISQLTVYRMPAESGNSLIPGKIGISLRKPL